MDHVEHEENVIEEEGSANEFTEDNDIAVGNELHNDKASCDENGKEKEQFAVSDAKDKLEPRVGMEFDDDEQAYQFYNEYARRQVASIYTPKVYEMFVKEFKLNNNKQRRQRRVLSAEERTIKKRVEPSD
ncbi:hypothetical protein GW17_00040574, partial [Ensete ventricosum]